MSERSELTADPSQKLRQIEEFAEYPFDPRVSAFAHYLAGSMNPHLVPQGFIMASIQAIYDIERGIHPYTNQPLNTGLEGSPRYVFDLLTLNIPDLAELAFSQSFAEGVRKHFQGFLEVTKLDPNAIVPRPITTLEHADRFIIKSAQGMFNALDWRHFGWDNRRAELSQAFDTVYPLILRQAGMNFPLNILMESEPREFLKIKETSPQRKISAGGEWWIMMTRDQIGVEEATLMRDWLYLKAPVAMPTMLKLADPNTKPIQPDEVIKYFASSDQNFAKAGKRAMTFMLQL